jgi:hypothetical protein
MAIVLDGTTGITTPALDTDTKISPADLGTGTPDATNFLRGDGSWQVISTTPTTDQVLTATAGASVGAVGTYAILRRTTYPSSIVAGSTYAGSNLAFQAFQGRSNANNQAINSTDRPSTSISGTWRALQDVGNSNDANWGPVTLFLRIS